jgi:phosphoadenosine phosphosulfate reductase
MKDHIDSLNRQFSGSSAEYVLSWFLTEYSGKIAFSTSLGSEDQVITHMLARLKKTLKIFTLDTGRLFQETYDTLDITQKKYGLFIEVYFPDTARVEEMVRTNGINLFYDGVDNRRLCCHIRKIEPLQRALEGMAVWITGLRKAQSVTRSAASMIEWDGLMNIIKVNPLIHWDNETLSNFIREKKVLLHELHSKGYPSIGCMPCTRAIQEGEDVRAGRWWWELPESKECGLHKKH